MLQAMGFSLQANAKVIEGRQHEDRDAQFGYLNRCVGEHVAAGQPVISVDTKKKELVGEFKNGGREYQPQGHTGADQRPRLHDQGTRQGDPLRRLRRDSTNTGWVSVGTDHDTSAFAVATLRRWWDTIGRRRYPHADRLLICADGGGSNGYRIRAWKVELAAARRRDRARDHRLPSAPGHQQMEQDRAPAVLPDHRELARTTTRRATR